MSGPFTLVVPTDPRFRTIATDVAARFAELSGGAAAGVQAAVKDAVDAIADGQTASDLRLTFRSADSQVHVELSCGGRRTSITCPL